MGTPGKEIVKSSLYENILPPHEIVDIEHYFLTKIHSEGEFEGFDVCAHRLGEVLEQVIEGNVSYQGFNYLPVDTENGHYKTKIFDEMPKGTRALMELTYAMTGAQITQRLQTRLRDKIILNGNYWDTPLEFVEVFTTRRDMLEMRWGVRLAEPLEALEPVHDTRRAIKSETVRLVDDTLLAINWLEEDPNAAIEYLSRKAA